MTIPIGPIAEVDPRPRRLLERYASLAGGMALDIGDHLVELTVPPSEAKWFDKRACFRIALDPGALAEAPDAEILVNGSALLRQLIEAIRDRGSHQFMGVVTSVVIVDETPPLPEVPVEGVFVPQGKPETAILPVGKLLARLSIHGGSSIVERLVESSVIDLTSGSKVDSTTQELCAGSGSAAAPPVESTLDKARRIERLSMKSLLPLLFADLEGSASADVSRIASESNGSLTTELARIDAYYAKMAAEVDPEDDPDSIRDRKKALVADHKRRKADEEHRHSVRVTVHPVQMIEWGIPVQHASWKVVDRKGIEGSISATRVLVGDAHWKLTCPTCGIAPTAVSICREAHAACVGCSASCGVCGVVSCRDHGLQSCAVEEHPVCSDHSAKCPSCRRTHCESHSGTCEAKDHRVCVQCLGACAHCGKRICKSHGTLSGKDSPKGARFLCSACVVYCEGGQNEPVGPDEVTRCTSCERHICMTHVAECAVDKTPHCSGHLRRSDKSGRLACEKHRGGCSYEPNSVMASDELAICATCGKTACGSHCEVCSVDGLPHCLSHLARLADMPGKVACEQHRETCSVDGQAFSLTKTSPCPVCEKAVCDKHQRNCDSCGRKVCSRHESDGKCKTCATLRPESDPEEALITASLDANGGEPIRAKEWRISADARHTVAELALGWGRRMVFTVRHGDTVADTVMEHGFFGAKRRR